MMRWYRKPLAVLAAAWLALMWSAGAAAAETASRPKQAAHTTGQTGGTAGAPDTPDTPGAPSGTEPLALMSDVAARLSHAAVISGHFEQSKSIAGFKNPLVSSGEFAAARDHGIVWHTKAPFESLLSVTQERIATQHEDGDRQTLVGPGDEPVLRMVNEVLYAIMTADLKILAQQFEVSGQLLPGREWALDLRPRDAMLQQWITRVQLWGDTYVRKVVLHEAQEDQSTIVLSEHQAGSKVPDALLGK